MSLLPGVLLCSMQQSGSRESTSGARRQLEQCSSLDPERARLGPEGSWSRCSEPASLGFGLLNAAVWGQKAAGAGAVSLLPWVLLCSMQQSGARRQLEQSFDK